MKWRPNVAKPADNERLRQHLYKTELIEPRKPWRTVDQVELATAEWVDWFNHRRLYEYCGDIPPAELEAAYHAHHRAQPPAELTHR